ERMSDTVHRSRERVHGERKSPRRRLILDHLTATQGLRIMETRHFLSTFIAALTAIWAWDALVMHPMTGDWPWLVQRHALYLTGIWSIGLMSLVMVLATRPVWLEGPLGGMDKIYQAHKWAGILAVLFGAAHWLIKLGSDRENRITAQCRRTHHVAQPPFGIL